MGQIRKRSILGQVTKRPVLAAVFNAFAWGLGYLFFTRRKLLGFALFLWIFTAVWGSDVLTSSPGSFPMVFGVMGVAWALLSLALALDAYRDVRAKTASLDAGMEGPMRKGKVRVMLANARGRLKREPSDERRGYVRALEDVLRGIKEG